MHFEAVVEQPLRRPQAVSQKMHPRSAPNTLWGQQASHAQGKAAASSNTLAWAPGPQHQLFQMANLLGHTHQWYRHTLPQPHIISISHTQEELILSLTFRGGQYINVTYTEASLSPFNSEHLIYRILHQCFGAATWMRAQTSSKGGELLPLSPFLLLGPNLYSPHHCRHGLFYFTCASLNTRDRSGKRLTTSWGRFGNGEEKKKKGESLFQQAFWTILWNLCMQVVLVHFMLCTFFGLYPSHSSL